MLVFEISMKPVAKGRPKFSRFGAYTPAKTKKAEALLKKELQKIYQGPLITDAVMLIVDFIFAPNKSDSKKVRKLKESGDMFHTKKPDLDNLTKLVKDALNSTILKDDAQISIEFCKKMYGPEDKIIINIIKL